MRTTSCICLARAPKRSRHPTGRFAEPFRQSSALLGASSFASGNSRSMQGLLLRLARVGVTWVWQSSCCAFRGVVVGVAVVVLCFSRCATCSRFSQRIKNALAEADKIPLQRAQEQHINQVMSHRTLCTRLNHLSEESTSRPGISDPTGILKIDLDGADQSKTLIPKGLDNNKFLSSLWRAQLHVMGALVHGAARPSRSSVEWLVGCCAA